MRHTEHRKNIAKAPQATNLSKHSFTKREPSSHENLDNLDLRPIESGLLNPRFVRYDMEIKKLVNPNDLNSVWLQGAAGGGIARILLSTNATRIYFIESTKIDTDRLSTLVDPAQNIKKLKYQKEYLQQKYNFGFSLMAGSPRLLAEDFYVELMALGVPLVSAEGKENIRITNDSKSNLVHIDFKWGYGDQKPKQRRVTYIEADLLEPETYLPQICQKEKTGINGFYQMASYEILNVSHLYLPKVAELICSGGYVLIDPRQNFNFKQPYRFKQLLQKDARKIIDPFSNQQFAVIRNLFNRQLKYYGQAVRPYQILSA